MSDTEHKMYMPICACSIGHRYHMIPFMYDQVYKYIRRSPKTTLFYFFAATQSTFSERLPAIESVEKFRTRAAMFIMGQYNDSRQGGGDVIATMDQVGRHTPNFWLIG